MDAEPKRDRAAAIDALMRQVSSPVRWEDVVTAAGSRGRDAFVEMGPGSVLAGLIRKIDRGVAVVNVADAAGLDSALSK